MVGKAKRPRLHRAAPRPWPARDPPPLPEPGPKPSPGPGPGGWNATAGKDWDFSSPGVFSGLKIDPDTLVKKLDLDSRSIISSRTGLEEKTILSKKEKMKLRKEKWLQKIESVKLAKQKQKAEAKRKATPVVGDMQPLMEALPELSDLTTGSRGRKPPRSRVKAKAEPADFCLMKQAQKHQLFSEKRFPVALLRWFTTPCPEAQKAVVDLRKD
ncbi:ribosome biogenesis protein SLX9 homolog isoform X2 [Grus americana]|uniref:ribosome biogenesis protein SLX9 homolog isoform X2 n=1 Tax=Grus americana TaxID=9117 RepID=UPI0024078FC3|nr:ribosome biogenesis protein SLX9 homolog isoform X2 [Grus americana]